MPGHPSDRNSRRELARIYDGDRALIREMEKKYRQMWAKDLLSLDEEWNCHGEVTVAAYVLAFQASEWMESQE